MLPAVAKCEVVRVKHVAMRERTDHVACRSTLTQRKKLMTSLTARNSRPQIYLCNIVQPLISIDLGSKNNHSKTKNDVQINTNLISMREH